MLFETESTPILRLSMRFARLREIFWTLSHRSRAQYENRKFVARVTCSQSHLGTWHTWCYTVTTRGMQKNKPSIHQVPSRTPHLWPTPEVLGFTPFLGHHESSPSSLLLQLPSESSFNPSQAIRNMDSAGIAAAEHIAAGYRKWLNTTGGKHPPFIVSFEIDTFFLRMSAENRARRKHKSYEDLLRQSSRTLQVEHCLKGSNLEHEVCHTAWKGHL